MPIGKFKRRGKRKRSIVAKRRRSISRKRNSKHKRMRMLKSVKTSYATGSRVIRSYESERIYRACDLNATQTGFGFSLKFTYDVANKTPIIAVQRGFASEAKGGNATDYAFFPGATIHSDFINLTRVYRYCKIRKMTMHVCKLAPPFNVANSASASYQVDYGTDIIIPWAAEPDLINYSTGEFSNIIASPDNYKRYKYKYMRPATSKNGVQGAARMTVVPRQPTMTPQVFLAGGVASLNPQVRMRRTPPIDIFRFKENLGDLNSVGWIWVWHHPGLKGGPVPVTRQVWFTFEFEYFGVRPVGITRMDPCLDKITSDEHNSASEACSFGRWGAGPLTGSCPTYSVTGTSPPTGGISYWNGGVDIQDNGATGPCQGSLVP